MKFILNFGVLAPLSLAAGLLTASPLLAQESDTSDAGELEEVIVTGSRIRRDGFQYSAPVEIIGEDRIDAIGTTNIGDFIQTIPQSVASVNNANSAFSVSVSGQNLTSLRNLGTARTLVLVNGRRFVSGVTPSVGYGVDLNAIPTAMIDRIEVLTGGASAVYGSDAVSGVVNIVLKDDFEGIMVEGQLGASAEGDMNKEDIYLTFGGELGDGGNAWMSLGYSSSDSLFARDRDYSNTDLIGFDADGDGLAESEAWLGSSFVPGGRFGNSTFGQFNGDGTPFVFGIADRPNSQAFNRADFRTIFSPVDRRFASGGLDFPLADRTSLIGEFTFAVVETETELEPFALDLNSNIWFTDRGGLGGLDVATHPLVPQLLRDNLLAVGVTNLNQLGVNGTARRLVEFGERFSNYQRSTLRGLVGVEHEFENGWMVSGYYSYGRTDSDISANGQINVERAALALDVEQLADGTVRCRNDLARIQGCVPFNPFGVGSIDAAQVAYLQLPTVRKSLVEQEVVNLTVSGDTGLELPGGSIAVAFGTEYREERGADTPGDSVQQGITAGNASAPTDGSFDVLEAFVEFQLPLHDRINLDAAARLGDYSTVGNEFTWKLGTDIEVLESLRFRGTVSTSVRAPNVADLFSGAGETFVTITDPCNGIDATTAGNIAENCRSIPVIADRIADQGSFTLTQVELQSTGGFLVGNTDVDSETADSFTAGLVWQPDFANRLSASLDYYNIEIDDGIAITPRTVVLQRCFDVAPSEFDPTCGGQARRDFGPNAGALIEVDSGVNNENRFETSGLDLQVSYGLPIGPGDLTATMFYNYLIDFDTIGIFSGDVDKDAGEVLFPENRIVLNASYALNNWQFAWRARLWDRVKDSNTPELTNENSGLNAPFGPALNEIPTYVYHDLSAAYQADSYSIRVGLNNAFDKQPPQLTQGSQYGNTGTNVAAEAYDPVGQSWYVQFTYTP
ncbi:MAG: TonB-dependent receptor [Pseudomonadota bacterium]